MYVVTSGKNTKKRYESKIAKGTKSKEDAYKKEAE